MAGQRKGRVPVWVLVVALAAGAAILVGVLVGVSVNKSEPAPESLPPPQLPPLTGPLPQGRGLDWSRAGYRDGFEPIPEPPPKFNVRDFGARGDNATDDTAALQAAVAAASDEGGVVLFPAGTYLLSRPLEVNAPNVVLRGEGEGRTILYIPVALADVYPGSWGVDASGKAWTSWMSGGAFVSIMGEKQRSGDGDTFLTNVNGEVEQGATVLPVDRTRGFEVGQWVRIYINDESTGGEPSGDALEEEEAGGEAVSLASVQPASDPSGAAEGAAAAAGAGAGAGAGAAGVGPRSGVRLAAADGTVAAWVYGDNRADSGSGSALNKDEVHFSARVTAIGKDWVSLDRELPFPVRRRWTGTISVYAPTVEEAGVERLTIQFQHSLMGPHLTERGYNAIAIEYAANCWVRQVTVLNADNAIRYSNVDRSTIEDVTVGVTAPRHAPDAADGMNGHHALSMTEGHANLLTRFNVTAKTYHDVTLASGATLNVVSNGTGVDLNIDLHRAGSFGNLLARLDMGRGTRPFKSGGRADRGAHSGRQNTFWNLGTPPRGDPPPSPPPPPPSPPPASPAKASGGEEDGSEQTDGQAVDDPKDEAAAAEKEEETKEEAQQRQEEEEQQKQQQEEQQQQKEEEEAAAADDKEQQQEEDGKAAGKGEDEEGGGKSRRLLRAPGRPAASQLQQRGRRRLAEVDAGGAEDGTVPQEAPAPLQLPDCSYGAYLTFVGYFSGDPCPGMEWLVKGLGDALPADLHSSQARERRARMVAAAAEQGQRR